MVGLSEQTEQLRLDLQSSVYTYHKVCVDGRYLFMKALRPDTSDKEYYRETLRKEYELGSSLHCDYIVRYTQLVDTDEGCCVLMDYVSGQTLKDFVQEHPDYFHHREHLRRFLLQLLTALREMHQHQALHLDLKPTNIMLTGVNRDVRLIDLGCSYTDARPTTTGHTDRYAAPEQLNGEGNLDARTDLYAVGRIIEDVDGGRHFRRIARRCVAENPDDRFQSADELVPLLARPRRIPWLPLLLFLFLLFGGLFSYRYFATPRDGVAFVEIQAEDTCYLRVLSARDRTLALTAAPEGSRAYEGDLVLPDSIVYRRRVFHITEIEPWALNKCSQLTNIHFPATLVRIGQGAFYGCRNIVNLHLPTSLREVEMEAFVNCRRLQTVSWPSSVSEVPRCCFVSCKRLRSVTLPEGVTVIRQDAFVDCVSLVDVSLPASLRRIDRGVFFKCASLREVTIPSGVRELGEYLFFQCPSLEHIDMEATTPPYTSVIVDSAFHGTISVPQQSIEAYRKAQGFRHLTALLLISPKKN